MVFDKIGLARWLYVLQTMESKMESQIDATPIMKLGIATKATNIENKLKEKVRPKFTTFTHEPRHH